MPLMGMGFHGKGSGGWRASPRLRGLTSVPAGPSSHPADASPRRNDGDLQACSSGVTPCRSGRSAPQIFAMQHQRRLRADRAGYHTPQVTRHSLKAAARRVAGRDLGGRTPASQACRDPSADAQAGCASVQIAAHSALEPMSLSFQSRFVRAKWPAPSTEAPIKALASIAGPCGPGPAPTAAGPVPPPTRRRPGRSPGSRER